METKVGGRDVVIVGGGGWQVPEMRIPGREQGAAPEAEFPTACPQVGGCPSVLDVARCESGDLNEAEQASIRAHARRCARCETALAEIRQARLEILGSTVTATSAQSRRAAEQIEAILRRALQ